MLLSHIGAKNQLAWDTNKIQSVLVFRYDRIGDMVITTPFFAALKRFHPQYKVSVLASKVNAEVVKHNRDIDTVITYPNSFLGKLRTLLQLRKRKFDLVVDLNHSVIWQALLEIRLIKPKYVISPKKGSRYGLKPEFLTIYDKMSRVPVDQPLANVYLSLVDLLSSSNSISSAIQPTYKIPLGDKNLEYAIGVTNQLDRPIIGVNLFGGRQQMSLNSQDVPDLLQAIREILGEPPNVVLMCPPQHRASMIDLAHYLDGNHTIVVQPAGSILDTAALVGKLDFLLTVDTSLVHIACAYNTPMLIVYANAPELFKQWRPLSTALTEIVFSQEQKSLSGYPKEEVLEKLRQQLTTLKNQSFQTDTGQVFNA